MALTWGPARCNRCAERLLSSALSCLTRRSVPAVRRPIKAPASGCLNRRSQVAHLSGLSKLQQLLQHTLLRAQMPAIGVGRCTALPCLLSKACDNEQHRCSLITALMVPTSQ